MSQPRTTPPEARLVLLGADDLRALLETGRLPERPDGLTYAGEPPDAGLSRALRIKLDNLAADPGQAAWYSYWGLALGYEVAGLIGCKGRPDAEGRVEIGYGLGEAWRGRGLGRLMVQLFVAWIEGTGMVSEVVACTLPDNLASQAVLRSAGFHETGLNDDGELGWSRLQRQTH